MAVKLRLARHGAKRRPFYRVVAADARARRDGRFIEILGTYQPQAEGPQRLRLKLDRVDYWVGNGAQPTDTVRGLIARARTAAEAPAEAPAPAEA